VGLGIENKIAVGGTNSFNNLGIANALNQNTNTATKSKMTSKERFYANVERSRNKANTRADLKQQWDRESYELREDAKFKAEAIARGLLGDPNNKLSNKTTLRYGEHGKLAVRISGDKAGTWYDFSTENGGDIFSLVQNKRGGDFKDAAEYLRQSVGMSSTSNIKLVYDHKARDTFLDSHKAKQASEAEIRKKAKYTQDLYKRSKDINNNHVAYRYLNKVRGISCELSVDIKTTGIYDNQLGKSFPALVVYARDGDGNVTGGQRLLLDARTSGKANIDLPKKSFGKISGSFVAIAGEEEPQVTIIVEGLETALSVKQGLSEHSAANGRVKTKIICSLGISNIKNYPAKQNEKIIIASDNDGKDSVTHQTIENAKIELEKQGAFVEIVRPEKEGDFNDVLQDKENGGSKAISDAFNSSLIKHTALTVAEYFGESAFNIKFNENNNKNINENENGTSNDKASLAYIEKYNLPQSSIIDAYRKSDLSGKIELDHLRKELESAANHFTSNEDVLKEARSFGYEITVAEFTKQLIGMNAEESKNHCTDIRDSSLSEYLRKNLSKFDDQKLMIFDVEKMKPVISAEQKFLKETYQSLRIPIEDHNIENRASL
jgi:hypothetical protein